MSGHTQFTHKVCFEGPLMDIYPKFIQSRNYLWSQFGPSAELMAISFVEDDYQWAWQCDDKVTVIFLKDKALVQYLLVMEKYANN